MKELTVISETEAKSIRHSALKIARFIHEKKIQNVVVLGYSGQLAAYAVKLAWQHLYGKEPMPHFHAIGSFASKIHQSNWRNQPEKTLAKLRALRPKLFSSSKKNEATLLFDSYVLEGNTMNLFKQIFQESGFKHIFTGSLYVSPARKKDVGREIDIVGEFSYASSFEHKRSYLIKQLIMQTKMNNLLGLRNNLRPLSGKTMLPWQPFKEDLRKMFLRKPK